MENICSICNNLLTRKIIQDIAVDGSVYNVYFCDGCKVGLIVPTPTKEYLASLYAAGSYRSKKGRRFNPFIEFFIYRSRILRRNRIKRYVRRGSILDIGCGRGLFLDIMRKDGWTVTGAEFSEDAALDVAATYNIPVVAGEPSGWGFKDGSFDVITISHVLEHLHYPARMVEQCRRLLRPGGLLVCATPNIAGLQAAAGKGGWFHLDIPCHVHHFSEMGLAQLLRRHSFTIVRTRRFDLEYGPFGWLQTLLNISGISKNYLYSLLKNPELRKKEPAGSGASDMLRTLLLLPLYFPLAVVLSLFESFVLKRGGTVEVFAVRE